MSHSFLAPFMPVLRSVKGDVTVYIGLLRCTACGKKTQGMLSSPPWACIPVPVVCQEPECEGLLLFWGDEQDSADGRDPRAYVVLRKRFRLNLLEAFDAVMGRKWN